MKRKRKVWIIFGIIIFIVSTFIIYTRPISILDIINENADMIHVDITEWEGDTRKISSVDLSKSEFDQIVNIMMVYKYKKVIGRKKYFDNDDNDTGDFYFLYLDCYDSSTNMNYTLTFVKGGYLEVNKRRYYLDEGGDAEKDMIHDIYLYICGLRKEQ